MSFSKLGERVDLAEQNLERAKRFLGDIPLQDSLSVTIPNSHFGDGSQQVANALTKVLLAHIDDSLMEAIAMLEDEADEARKAMAQAMAPAPKQPKQKASA